MAFMQIMGLPSNMIQHVFIKCFSSALARKLVKAALWGDIEGNFHFKLIIHVLA